MEEDIDCCRRIPDRRPELHCMRCVVDMNHKSGVLSSSRRRRQKMEVEVMWKVASCIAG